MMSRNLRSGFTSQDKSHKCRKWKGAFGIHWFGHWSQSIREKNPEDPLLWHGCGVVMRIVMTIIQNMISSYELEENGYIFVV